jgi:predicted SprT family Zn-dependent metalloprotease/DNA-directed RNA polymerase subunit RPC12/RpoP
VFLPTKDFYDFLQELYNVFNNELFDNSLSNCLITVQRRKRVMGYFSANRWVNDKQMKVHEFALNPTYFASCSFIELFQTIVHEMCHLWQFEHGKRPSIKTYHNKEWANKMESVGLIPSSTGRVGGRKTGQYMNDYPLSGGLFENLCIRLYKEDMFIKWFDRFPEEVFNSSNFENLVSNSSDSDILENLYTTVSNVVSGIVPVEEVKALNISKQKTKYICPVCSSAVWGRNNLSIKCNACSVDFRIVVI